MARPETGRIEVLILGPVIALLVVASLWLAVQAALENMKLAQGADQIVRMVAIAREMRIDPKQKPAAVTAEFIKRAVDFRAIERMEVKPAFLGKDPEYGFKNPWDGRGQVFFYPSSHVMRIEVDVSPAACRRLLLLYAKDAWEMGLRRVDVKETEGTGAWRQLYQASGEDPRKQIENEGIYSGCGDQNGVSVSFSFLL